MLTYNLNYYAIHVQENTSYAFTHCNQGSYAWQCQHNNNYFYLLEHGAFVFS